MKDRKKILLLIIISLLAGGMLTSYVGGYQQNFFMPLRNLILLGEWESRSSENIDVSRYPHGSGINPVHVALLVRDDSRHVLDGGLLENQSIGKIIEVADFFVESGEEFQHRNVAYKVWWYDFDFPPYQLTAPWSSGMAQGFVIEVLLAAYELTGDEIYLSNARLAGNTLSIPIEDGGVAILFENGNVWFEEYAQKGSVHPIVLNGHNYALGGLWYLCLEDNEYCALHTSGVTALKSILSDFDARVWSRYDLYGNLSDWKYQAIHVEQLRELSAITGDPYFEEYADRFQLQLALPFSAFYRMIVDPGRFLIILIIINSLFVFSVIVMVFYIVKKRKTRQDASINAY